MSRIFGYMRKDEVDKSEQILSSPFLKDKNFHAIKLDSATLVSLSSNDTCSLENEKYAIVLDGVIFNKAEVDGILEDINNKNDILRILYLVDRFGILDAFKKINGDFAVAILEKFSKKLWLIRDRFGVRPLYYYNSKEYFGFSSIASMLIDIHKVSPNLNKRFVATFAGGHYRHIDNRRNESPYSLINQLPASHILCAEKNNIYIEKYWDMAEMPDHETSENTLAEEYRSLLIDSVGMRLRVTSKPIFTLSGGLDSSSVMSCAVEILSKKLPAVSSVYADPTYDESVEISSMIGSKVSDWERVNIDPPDIVETVTAMVRAHGEPVATATWLSHYILCQHANQSGYEAIFGGLGGDELNAGEYEYFIYFFADLLHSNKTTLLDREIEKWINYHDHPVFRKSRDSAFGMLKKVVDLSRQGICLPEFERMRKYNNAVNKEYFNFADDFHELDHIFNSYLKNRNYHDVFRETLPCCLRAQDRQSVAWSLMQINPFLDHRLFEFMFRIPGTMKIRDGITKHLLRKAMHGILPEETRTRIKKTGWNAPAHQWFSQGSGYEFIADLIESRRFRESDIFNVKFVREIFEEHQIIIKHNMDTKENHMMFLWQLLNLEIWQSELNTSKQIL